MDADVDFFWDPVCPFAWLTSRWLVQVAEARDLEVDWRFICLRILNEHRDYDREFPAGYLGFHTSGQRLLRVAAAVREDEGPAAMGALYSALGTAIWERDRVEGGIEGALGGAGLIGVAAGALAEVGLAPGYVDAADDDRFDPILRTETEQALARTGDEVGTPILTLHPPDGPSFFGPVLSRLPDDLDTALDIWDAIGVLGRFGPFTELKRSMRELPDLPLMRALS